MDNTVRSLPPYEPIKPGREPVTNAQVLSVLAFVMVVLPTAVVINVLLWILAGRMLTL